MTNPKTVPNNCLPIPRITEPKTKLTPSTQNKNEREINIFLVNKTGRATKEYLKFELMLRMK